VFEPVDFYKIDSLLTEEQKLIKKTAREFALKELAPKAIERDEKKIWPYYYSHIAYR